MRLRILGSAAGGGFPQWNCGCLNCAGFRAGKLKATSRTQESVAISADGNRWFLLNVSPEVRGQIESFPALWPQRERHSPICGVVLGNGDLDHCLGLLSLRESHPLVVYATEAVTQGFTLGNVLYRTLERFPGQVRWQELALRSEIPLVDPADGRNAGLSIQAIPLPGQVPLHLKGLRESSTEDNVGLKIRETSTGRTLVYLSSVTGPSPELDGAVAGADCVIFDGTFWSSDELIDVGAGSRRAEDMGHWPLSGATGSLAYLSTLTMRRLLIHINNTNPILREDGRERAQTHAAGVEIACDGQDIVL